MNYSRKRFWISVLFLSCWIGEAPFIETAQGASLADYGSVGEFSLVERSGSQIQLEDLLGKVWVVNFIFTRCSGPCPLLTSRMREFQDKLPEEIRLLSLSVDPLYDTPAVLSRYAENAGADKERWLFLTGDKTQMYRFIRNSFHVGATHNTEKTGEGDAFIHSMRFALVDQKGSIRGYYDGGDRGDLSQIPRDIRSLRGEGEGGLLTRLPSVNAGLNILCTVLLLSGYRFIRMKKVVHHKVCMGLAFLVSVLFLISYLVYHAQVGSVPFQGTGWIRTFYFILLISHAGLAVLIVPLALVTLYRAWKGEFEKHVLIARWTLPVWLYVSVTGVMVYWMVYVL